MQILNDTLNLNKIENNKFDYKFNFYNITELINRCGSQIKPKCKLKNIKFIQDLNGKQNYLWLDKIRITQSIVNFLNNASKFTENNGKIIIKLTQNQMTDKDKKNQDEPFIFDSKEMEKLASYDPPIEQLRKEKKKMECG